MVALYGEIGESKIEGRDRKIELGFGQYMFSLFRTSNGLLRSIFGKMGEGGIGGGVCEATEGIFGRWGLVSI